MIVAEWGNTHVARTRVTLTTFKGRKLLDIRKFFDAGNDGELVATRKGISLRVEDLPELMAGLREAKRLLRETDGVPC